MDLCKRSACDAERNEECIHYHTGDLYCLSCARRINIEHDFMVVTMPGCTTKELYVIEEGDEGTAKWYVVAFHRRQARAFAVAHGAEDEAGYYDARIMDCIFDGHLRTATDMEVQEFFTGEEESGVVHCTRWEKSDHPKENALPKLLFYCVTVPQEDATVYFTHVAAYSPEHARSVLWSWILMHDSDINLGPVGERATPPVEVGQSMPKDDWGFIPKSAGVFDPETREIYTGVPGGR